MHSSSSCLRPRALGVVARLALVGCALVAAGCAGGGPGGFWKRVTLVAPGAFRTVARAGEVAWLPRSPRTIPAALGGADDPLVDEAFLVRTRTTGLIVLEGDAIVLERYRLGADAASRFTSWSMAKSVVSTLIGVGLAEGRIRSLDDAVSDYAPSLRDSAYAGVSIRDVLQMASGVRFDERYDHALSDIRKLFYRLIFGGVPVRSTLEGARHDGPAGVAVRYASLDTQALGAVLAAVNGEPLARTLERTLWQRLGMESDASWNLDRAAASGGDELAFCCLNATLRDWARFGLFIRDADEASKLGRDADEASELGRDAVGAAAAGPVALPAGWIEEATRPARALGAPGTISGTRFGYGYHWWIPPDADGEFLAIGVYGQFLYVNRPARVVIVKTGADPAYRMDDEAHVAFFREIVQRLQAEPAVLRAATR